ncbi:hypothetical protein [Thalassiella azotivora]
MTGLEVFAAGVLVGLLAGLRTGYRTAIRVNGRQMVTAGARRMVRGRW